MPTVDLTHVLDADAPVYPGDPPVSVDAHATHERDGYRVTALAAGTHAGTHVDAPAHTEADGQTLGSVDVERFRWRARRVDCRHRGPTDPVRVADLPPAVRTAGDDTGERPPAAGDGEESPGILALWTGHDRRYGRADYHDGPYLTPGAARACARRDLDLAVDAPSVDPGPDRAVDDRAPLAAHHELLGAGRLLVENLTGLGAVPGEFTLRAYPLAVDADGAPVRAVAEW